MLWWDKGYAIYLFQHEWETWNWYPKRYSKTRFVARGMYNELNMPPFPIDFPCKSSQPLKESMTADIKPGKNTIE